MARIHLPFIIHPTATGLITGIIPLILLHPEVSNSRIPAIIIGMGLPLLALFSLAFLLCSLPALLRATKNIDSRHFTLPLTSHIGKPLTVESDPPRPAFLPGVRLFLTWSFTFGPFREKLSIPLPASGKGGIITTFSRRGLWEGQSSYLASDPFGLFTVRFFLAITHRIIVPPDTTDFSSSLPQGRSAQAAQTSPRLNEQAEERLERRPYIPGDDPRRLDWKHYAHIGELLIQTGEDPLPAQGRIWLQTVCTPSLLSRRRFRQLNNSLSLTRAAVQTLKSGEILCRLPGESDWLNTNSDNWLARLSASQPAPVSASSGPGPGDSVVVISDSSDIGGAFFINTARAQGCRVIFLQSNKPSELRRCWRLRNP